MVIGINEILRRIKKSSKGRSASGREKLIEDLGQRELKNPEGVGVDLRLGAVYEIVSGGAFIEADGPPAGGLGNRKGVKTKLIAKFKPRSKKQTEIIIKPGDYFLVSTFEKINTPRDLMPLVFPRTSLFRAGLLLLNSKTDPGYKGVLTMGLTNLSKFDIKLQLGARICNVVFFEIKGETVSYRGQHQGGRISPHNEERQV